MGAGACGVNSSSVEKIKDGESNGTHESKGFYPYKNLL